MGDLGDRAAASARLADTRERARSEGDDVGAARLELAGLDLRLAAFSSPDVLDLAVREGTDADSYLGFHVERAELDWTTPLPDGAEMDTELARLAKRAEALGAPRLAAAVQLRRAYVALRQREPEAAIRFATDAELAFAETGDEASAHLATVHAAAAALWAGRQGDEGVLAAIGVWGRDGGSFSWALGLGVLLVRVGRLLERQGLPEAALAAHRHAGVLHEALGADLNAARSLVDRSGVLDALGQYGEAASLLEAAARRVERLTAEEGASGLVRAAGALVVARTFNLAISTRNVAALERMPELARHLAGRVRTLGVLDLVAGFDDDRTVQEAARLAAMVADHLDSEAAMAAVLAPLYRGMAARDRGDHTGASAYFDAALAASDTVPGRRRDTDRALVLGTAGRDDEAADAYARFVARAGEEGLAGPDPASTAVLRHEQAVLAHGQALRFFVTVGHPELAEPHLAELRSLAGDRFWEQEDEPWSALGYLAALHLAQRRLTEAADVIGLALEQLDRRRGGLQRDELRRSLVGESGAQGVHLTAAQVELALAAVAEEAGDKAAAGHHRDRSLELAERAKARALYDIVSRGASARPPDDPGDGDVLGEWRSANARAHLWRSRLATLADRPGGDADAGPVEALVAEAERDLAAAVARLGGVDGRLAEVVDPHAQPPSTAEMTAALPSGTVLLSYFATRGELLLWAADRSGVREICRHTDHERLLPGLVHVFLEGCRRPGPHPVGGAELSRLLLEPLPGADRSRRAAGGGAGGDALRAPLPRPALGWRCPNHRASPADGAEDLVRSQVLVAALRRLTPRQRLVVVWRYLFDFSVHETADALGLTDSKVRDQPQRRQPAPQTDGGGMGRPAMKGWESCLPAGFPIDRVHEAVRLGAERRRRRTRRYQRAVTGLCALLVAGTVVVVAGRDDPGEQLQAGPRPAAMEPGKAFPVTAANGKIAFIRSTGPGDPAPSIYLMNEDGSEQIKIAETTRGHALTWSPDGTRPAFDDVGGIYIINADGSGERRLPNSSGQEQWPAWSPDGTQLAFRDLSGGGIFVANVDGTSRRRLTDDIDNVAGVVTRRSEDRLFEGGQDLGHERRRQPSAAAGDRVPGI